MPQKPTPVPYLDRQEIERKAAELNLPGPGGALPLDAFDIARRIDIPINQIKFDQLDVAGMLVRGPGWAEIRVNSGDPYRRQNFTIAHELGHLILQHPGTWEDTRNTIYRRSSWNPDAEAGEWRAEYQANVFAAALLMPESVVRDRWQMLHSIPILASRLKVSKDALKRRLEDLSLIVITPKDVQFLDLSGWNQDIKVAELPALSDEQGPIPRFPPIALDQQGRINPMSDEEWDARHAAMSRVFRIASSRTDNDPRSDGGQPSEADKPVGD